ncbi:hypothetical protein BOTBODRAFT_178751 [Botryobasidium botryosum FD-172 SS1]|uniref:CID domain-containing protein n=1 Tax=Botryobasidium botryosum (strain FD-172 SS1) TaxID=930990 RepID=A0A067ME54_BOTB1|nr:hypothetical protein BOTBODRAFT_178751 [Botryobasidium botryosum FD-172 SS1]
MYLHQQDPAPSPYGQYPGGHPSSSYSHRHAPPDRQASPVIDSNGFRNWFNSHLATLAANNKLIIPQIAFIARKHPPHYADIVAHCIELHIRKPAPTADASLGLFHAPKTLRRTRPPWGSCFRVFAHTQPRYPFKRRPSIIQPLSAAVLDAFGTILWSARRFLALVTSGSLFMHRLVLRRSAIQLEVQAHLLIVIHIPTSKF